MTDAQASFLPTGAQVISIPAWSGNHCPRTGSASGNTCSKLTGLRGPSHSGRSLSSTLFDIFWSEELLPEPGFLFFFFRSVPRGIWILVPLSGIDPTTPALEVRSFNHLTSREVPRAPFDSHLVYLPA